MTKIRMIFRWYFLMNKRILKQPLFLVLLLMVPLLTIGVNLSASSEKSALVNVALTTNNTKDQTALNIIDRLVERSNSTIRYYAVPNAKQLKEDVSTGKARIGCLFPDHIDDLFTAYANQKSASLENGALGLIEAVITGGDENAMKHYRIQCFLATNDIISKLAREDLFARIFSDLQAAILKSWLHAHPEVGSMSQEERDRFVDESIVKNQLNYNFFALKYLDGTTITDEEIDHYLTSPMRGLLTTLLILTALGACLLLMADNRKGLFVWTRPSRRPLFHYGITLIPLFDIAAAMYVALYFSGTFTTWKTELPCMLLLVLCAAGFANFLRVLLRRITLIGSMIPIVICACLFLTPVFIDLSVIPQIQTLIPSYLYLRSIHGNSPMWQLAVYAAVTGGIGMLGDLITWH